LLCIAAFSPHTQKISEKGLDITPRNPYIGYAGYATVAYKPSERPNNA